ATPAQRAYQPRGLQVMELMADAVQVGMDDGTIRSDVGSPMKTAVTLWGMTHGVLQIAAIKERMLIEQFRLSIDELAGHAIEMAGRAMDPAR
ncbi:MAG: TetR/AcrR family transcriptional regulator, partial [Bacteroidota bacterium]